MYIPTPFRQTDKDKLFAFIDCYSFATLISSKSSDSVPDISHLPLVLERQKGTNGSLLGHMARSNVQWHTAAGGPVCCIFQGPDAYISPTWYGTSDSVPTWNYVTVHATGTMHIVDDDSNLVLEKLVDKHEQLLPQPWKMESLNADQLSRLREQIVCFRVEIESLEGQWKLNQHHASEVRRRTADALRQRGRANDLDVAVFMDETLSSTPKLHPPNE